MRTSGLGGFYVMWVTKLFTNTHKYYDFWPINGQIWPKIGFFGQILAFLAHLVEWPTKKHAIKVPFSFTWVQKLILTPIKIRIIAP